MAGLSSLEITVLVFVVFLAVVVVALLLYVMRRFKERKAKLLNELDAGRGSIQDRAFNRLAMARREARMLSDQGVDVSRAEELIAEGQGSFDTQHFDQAYRSAQSAHEALVNARLRGSRTTSAPLPSTVGSSSPARPPPGPAPPSGPIAPLAAAEPLARPTIAKNQAESQFQIRLLTEEIDALPARRRKDPNVVQSSDLRHQAIEATAKGDYTDAFRLALRGRRALGSTLETLPLGPGGTGSAVAGNGSGMKGDLAETAETVAGGERCPECGYPTLAGDAFCRGCGKPKTAMTCPTCGAARGADEPFCGQCGNRFA